MKRNYYKNILAVLTQLHKDHPSYEMGQHFELAFADYPSPWGISDKEMFNALKKYQAELYIDTGDINDEYIEDIIRDGLDLEHILDEKEEEE